MTASRSHAEIEKLLGAYALDAVDGEEHEIVDLHLRECPRCRAEVADFREVAALIGHGGGPAPEGVWERIVEALEPAPPHLRLRLAEPSTSPPPMAPVREGAGHGPGLGRRRGIAGRAVGLAAVAAVLVIGALGVVVVRQEVRLDGLQSEVSEDALSRAASAALVDSGSRTGELRSSDARIVTPVAVNDDGEGYLFAEDLPSLPDDRTYQLWGLVGKHTISLGTFDGKDRVVPFSVDRRGLTNLVITEEVAGGVPVSENTSILAGELSAGD